jgi:hypothetical protein
MSGKLRLEKDGTSSGVRTSATDIVRRLQASETFMILSQHRALFAGSALAARIGAPSLATKSKVYRYPVAEAEVEHVPLGEIHEWGLKLYRATEISVKKTLYVGQKGA